PDELLTVGWIEENKIKLVPLAGDGVERSARGHDPYSCAISEFNAAQIFANNASRVLRGIDHDRPFRPPAQRLDTHIPGPGKELENFHAGKIPRQNIEKGLLDPVGGRSNRAALCSDEPPAFGFS